MKVVLYALCWNDGPRLHFFFRHYDRFVTRYVIYDDGSDEATLSLLRQNPKVEIRRLERSHPDSFVLSEKTVSDACWKECRGDADWVIVTDIDELLWHPDMISYLARRRQEGVTVLPALGFQMIHDTFPAVTEDLCTLVTRGMPWNDMLKLSIFNPDAIDEIDFSPGRHKAFPVGNVVLPQADELLLLHYKYLGFDETFSRHRSELLGLGAVDLERGWGSQYWQTAESHKAQWERFASNAVDYRLFAGGANIETFPVPRWWRTATWPDREPRRGFIHRLLRRAWMPLALT